MKIRPSYVFALMALLVQGAWPSQNIVKMNFTVTGGMFRVTANGALTYDDASYNATILASALGNSVSMAANGSLEGSSVHPGGYRFQLKPIFGKKKDFTTSAPAATVDAVANPSSVVTPSLQQMDVVSLLVYPYLSQQEISNVVDFNLVLIDKIRHVTLRPNLASEDMISDDEMHMMISARRVDIFSIDTDGQVSAIPRAQFWYATQPMNGLKRFLPVRLQVNDFNDNQLRKDPNTKFDRYLLTLSAVSGQ